MTEPERALDTTIPDGPLAGGADVRGVDALDLDTLDLDTLDPEAAPSATDTDDPSAAVAPTLRRSERRVDVGLLVACFVIAAGVVLIIWGMSAAITGDDGVDRPDEIEEVSPVENAIQVLQQDAVVVDLASGYEGVLIIDGIELEVDRPDRQNEDLEPGEQQLTDPTRARFDPGNNVLSFRPTDGAPIEEFTEGRHSVTVIYWRIADGRGVDDQAYRWSFDVI